MPLSRRENFKRMISRSQPQWLPLDMPLTEPVAQALRQRLGLSEQQSPAEALGTTLAGIGSAFPHEPDRWRAAYQALGIELPANTNIGHFGIARTVPDRQTLGDAWHLTEMVHPLSGIEDLDQLTTLPWPDTSRPEWFEHLPQGVARIKADDRVAVFGCACSIFENSWYLRGMEELFMDMIEGDPVGDWLLDYFTNRSIHACSAGCRAGADIIHLGDDVATQRGMMMAPDFWRQHLKPRLARITAAIRETAGSNGVLISYHSDGDIREIIDELIELGIDVLNPLQPECMPLEEIIPAYRDRLAFWGTIGTQTTMPFGSPEDVRRAVEACAEWVRQGAAIVVAPTHVIEPDVPLENVEALVEACNAPLQVGSA